MPSFCCLFITICNCRTACKYSGVLRFLILIGGKRFVSLFSLLSDFFLNIFNPEFRLPSFLPEFRFGSTRSFSLRSRGLLCKNEVENHVKTLKKGSTDTVPPCFPHFSRLIKRLDQVFLPVDKAQKTLRKGNKGTVLPHFPRFPRL